MKRLIHDSQIDCRRSNPLGFTLIELIVAMGIIAMLVAILGTVVGNMMSKARVEATRATILKVDGLLSDRVDAFHKAIDKQDTDLRQYIQQIQSQLRQSGIYGVRDQMIEILVRKQAFRENFPQRFSDVPDRNGTGDPSDLFDRIAADPHLSYTAPNSTADPNPSTVSSELLYYMLTHMTVFGMAPVGADEFNTNEVADTDNDGLLEFVDGWGNPLRFYRWPTRLIKPDGATINRDVADLLIKGLPAPPASANERDPLNEDPDDPLSVIQREVTRLANNGINVSNRVNETNWHTFDTYHTPLIVSMGADQQLGLDEPFDTSNFGVLARPNDLNPTGALVDDITNRNQRAGGN